MVDTNSGTVEIRTEQVLHCYVVFGLTGSKAAPDKLPPLLSKAVSQWCRERPQDSVLAALPTIQNGQRVGVHLWFDA